MLNLFLGYILHETILFVVFPLAVLFSIIAFVRYLKLKRYKVFRNIAIILYIPVIIVAILFLVL